MAKDKWGLGKNFGDQAKNGLDGELAQSIRSDPESWASLAKIPGISDTLKDSPELLPQIIDDPKLALDTFNQQAAAPGTSDSSGFTQGTSTLDQLNKYVLRDDTTGMQPTVAVDKILSAENVFDAQVTGLEKSALQIADSAQSLLKGELPADVAAQIRQQSSEAALRFGLGTDQAAAALTARDLGLTSMQLQQEGVSRMTQAAAMRESSAKLAQSRAEFGRQYNLALDDFQTKVRTLNLQGLALEQDRQQFNAKQNMTILSFMVDLLGKQQELGYRYASSDMDATNMMGAFDSMMTQFEGLLG